MNATVIAQRRWIGVAIVAIVALLALLGCGVDTAEPDAEPTATPPTVLAEPETIVETVTETETIEVEVTPDVCLIAMAAADEAIEVAGDSFGLVADVTGEITDILDRDGYMITAEWNAIDDLYAGLMEPLAAALADAVDEYTYASLACELLAEED